MKKKQIILLHLLYWLFFIYYQFRFAFLPKEAGAELQSYILSYSFLFVNLSTFYVNYFVLMPWVYKKQRLYAIFGGIVGIFLFFSLLRYSVEEILFPVFFGFRNYHEKTSLVYYIYDNIFFSYTAIFVATLIWLLNNALKTEREKLRLIEENKNSQLQALKTQINPHFIFNTLNNIYSLVYQNSDKALPAIEELGQLLRYSTKDLEKDFITLDKEIGYLDSLIALEKLRLKHPELLNVEKKLNYPMLNISPMLLVPFVENAFKHGDFRNKGFEMKISDENKMLHFYLLNYKKEKMKDTVSGIGIENVKKRLEILYPNKYKLNIVETETDFTVDLKIDLKNEEN
ncbi:sensor histidine kinase [Chryseobacterium luquanense]|uniref:Histidine kinase n=1 Tax=Chryseobacterium luquanense TaxID=2983766 RepID=A0ABT3Y8X8_9FLAO|nr:histidine kinase [Chryseobacterium luquanense]MCX8534426.1 histidine kinase [Chryseobacterium luquanense]